MAQSDHNTTLRLTSVLLNDVNYVSWFRAAALALGGKRKYGYIGENSTCPDAKDPKYEYWIADDQLVRTWLLQSMKPHISYIFSFSESAKDLWKSIASLYGLRNNVARVFELKREISEAEQGTKSFTEHFGYLKKKWDELDTYRPHTTDAKIILKRVEEDKFFDVLSSLKPEYESLRSTILMSTELPSLSNVCATVQREETRKKVMNPNSKSIVDLDAAESSALMSSKDDKRRAMPFDKDKNSRAKGKREVFHCDHCNKTGHTKDRCWDIYPHLKATFDKNKLARAAVDDNSSFTIDQLKDFFNQLGNKTKPKAKFTSGNLLAFLTTPVSNRQVCIIDSGVTDHMANDPSSVHAFIRSSHKNVSVANGSTAPVMGSGKVKIFRSDNGTEFVKGTLRGYLRSHGIINQTRCVGTSQQNGVAERKLRHILETTRALMIQMHAKHRDKLDSRATKCVFFGYSSTKKGYICYHPPTRNIQISRDVVFDEAVAYFQCDSGSRSQGECYTDLAPLPVITEIPTATDSHRDNGGGVELVDLPNAVLDVHNEAVHEEASDNNVSVTDDNIGLQDVPHQVPESEVMIPQDLQPVVPIVRTSSREKKAPEKYKDFFTYHSAAYPIQAHLTYDHVGSSHSAFLSAISSHQEPRNYNEAKSNTKWRAPMENELRALDVNNTYNIVKLPPGKKTVRCPNYSASFWVISCKLLTRMMIISGGDNEITDMEVTSGWTVVVVIVEVVLFIKM
ncbi:uncharacterized protein LOC113329806 [Papaver somniferum]|uniref:uncharacterized protein LOC113329806 n=1 Tax=Papaver somniferum TaxID=3469 RepID=UPI000E703306|nr:uncharacterized protein LOC113329806 [Papaver somniferum]